MTAIFSRLVLIGVCAWLCTAVPEADASGPHHPSAKPRSHATEHAKAASWLRDGRFMVETVQRKLHRLLAAGFEIPLNLRGGFSFKGLKKSRIDQPGRDLLFRANTSAGPASLPPSPLGDKEMIEKSIDIQATPDEVFQVATRFEKYPEWTNVNTVKILERGRDGLGKLVNLECAPLLGRPMWHTLCYTYERPQMMRWYATAGTLKELVGSYEFRQLSGGRTRVVYKLHMELGFYLPSVIKTSTMSLIATSALNSLKRYTELPSTKHSLGARQNPSNDSCRLESTPIWGLCTLV